MKEEIKEVIDGLWDKIFFDLGRFEGRYLRLNTYLEMKNVGKAMMSVRKCKECLETICEALNVIGVLEGLLEEYDGGKNKEGNR